MNAALHARKRAEQIALPVAALIAFVLLWQLSVHSSGTRILPAPLEVGRAATSLLQKGILWSSIADSLRRVALGFVAGTVIGLPAGLLLGLSPALNQIANPVIQVLRPISPIAWIPIAIIFFGIGNNAAIFLVFLASVFPIVIASASAVSTVPTALRQTGRNFGLTYWQLLTRVIFPAALPQILLGLRIALGISWLVVVAAEMIAVDSGLGYIIIDARNSGKRYDLVVAAMLIIGAIGLCLDSLFRLLARSKSIQWGFRLDS